jgi:hypothetical protein
MTSDFCGHPVASFGNGHIRLEYLTDVGPRLARLFVGDSANLFGEFPGQFLDAPNGRFEFMGGHRLWHSPESLAMTYVPDQPVTAVESGSTLRLSAGVEPGSGLAKSISITVLPGEHALTIEHVMENRGSRPLQFAPWALSVMRLGGTAILPQPAAFQGEAAMLPNRSLSLWSYTRVADQRLQLGDDFVLVRAQPAMPAAKIGYLNTLGWVAYWLDGVLLVKRFTVDANAAYPDRGSNVEIYCNDQFIEIETLGPLALVEPGQSARLQERWECFTDLEQPFIPRDLAQKLK